LAQRSPLERRGRPFHIWPAARHRRSKKSTSKSKEYDNETFSSHQNSRRDFAGDDSSGCCIGGGGNSPV
jgi:hypothetical protein